MKKLYYILLRDFAAVKVLAALVASPQRYEYIARKVEDGELTNRSATEKNVNKAILMANQLINGIQKRNTLDS